MSWILTAWGENIDDKFWMMVEEGDFPQGPFPSELVAAMLLRVIRNLSY